VIPLREWIAWRLRLGACAALHVQSSSPSDDGHRSVFTDMLPLVREFGDSGDALHLPVSDLECRHMR
jgi:hypothetical protein